MTTELNTLAAVRVKIEGRRARLLAELAVMNEILSDLGEPTTPPPAVSVPKPEPLSRPKAVSGTSSGVPHPESRKARILLAIAEAGELTRVQIFKIAIMNSREFRLLTDELMTLVDGKYRLNAAGQAMAEKVKESQATSVG